MTNRFLSHGAAGPKGDPGLSGGPGGPGGPGGKGGMGEMGFPGGFELWFLVGRLKAGSRISSNSLFLC